MIYFKSQRLDNPLYNSSKSLTELANSLETDKGTADASTLSWGINFPTHYSWGYTTIYETYMSPLRETETPVEFLEVGIYDYRFPYASPKLWKSYFRNINLNSVDNFWGRIPNNDDITTLNDIGTNFFYADQGSETDWNEISNQLERELDFFVEDGSHLSHHMLYSLWRSIPLMKVGGIYFMEDIQHPTTAGAYGYNNMDVYETILRFQETNIFSSPSITEQMCRDIQQSYSLEQVYFGGPEHTKTGLAVFKKL